MFLKVSEIIIMRFGENNVLGSNISILKGWRGGVGYMIHFIGFIYYS